MTTTQNTPAPTEKPAKAKRVMLNPQPKINAKVKAATEAGGKLAYENRNWVLTKGKKTIKTMTAVEFSTETPDTITAALTA